MVTCWYGIYDPKVGCGVRNFWRPHYNVDRAPAPLAVESHLLALVEDLEACGSQEVRPDLPPFVLLNSPAEIPAVAIRKQYKLCFFSYAFSDQVLQFLTDYSPFNVTIITGAVNSA